MKNFEILCVTMHQKDFSKIKEMNIHSNVVFANQAEENTYSEMEFEGKRARMITTSTKGVGLNRNISLIYAQSDICLLADDDVVYDNNMEEKVLNEFESNPDADIIIFHFDGGNSQRKQIKYSRTRKHFFFERMPWGGIRIAFKLSSIKKANIWFTTLFGGGCVFPSGEDSMWLINAKKAGLNIYVSKETIGEVSFETSTWFTGINEKFFWGKGAFYQAVHPKTKYIWMLYFALRTCTHKEIKFFDKLKWMKYGADGYKKMMSYDEFMSTVKLSEK